MNESTYSERVNRAVHEYCAKLGFQSRDFVPPNNHQRTGDPRAKPFDIAMTLPKCSILLLETKVVKWSSRTVVFQPKQHEWLKVLWDLGVPIQLCYAMDVNMAFANETPWQGRPSDFILLHSRVSPPAKFLDALERVKFDSHESLHAHLDALTAEESGGNAKSIFTCVDARVCDVFESLTASALVVLYNHSTQVVTTLRGELFLAVFAELKRVAEQAFNPQLLESGLLANLVREVETALEEGARTIPVVIKRHVGRRRFNDLRDDLGRDEYDVGPSPYPGPLPDPKPDRGRGMSR